MGRIEYKEVRISIPEGVTVAIENKLATVQGPKGKLEQDFSHAVVDIEKEENEVVVSVSDAKRKEAALVGTISSHVNNMILGVVKGFRYLMKIVYAHFPIQLSQKKDVLEIKNFGGEKTPRFAQLVGDVKIQITKDDIILEGMDVSALGQTAANIRRACRIKNRDPRVFQDGIYVYKKGVIEDA
ncbi:MAG: 50S ribosomal protein L6 [Candidatus Ranarchaeia archaeon]